MPGRGPKQKGTRRENQLKGILEGVCDGEVVRAPMSRGKLIGEHDNVDIRAVHKGQTIRLQSKGKNKLPQWLSMEGVDAVIITVDGSGARPPKRYALIDFDLFIQTIKHELL